MLTAEVELPARADTRAIERLLESVARSRGLETRVKRSLKSYPGSIHWHLGKETQRGTLEVTFWSSRRRLWLSVHDNRTGPWTTEELSGLKTALEVKLRRNARRGAERTPSPP